MAAISGRAGYVNVNDGGDKVVGTTTEWSLDITTDTEELTVFGSGGWKEKMYMMSSWSGSMTVKWDMANAGQLAVQTKLGVGATVITPGTLDCKFYVNATDYYHGTAYIKSMSVKTPAGGIVEADISFEGSGALLYKA